MLWLHRLLDHGPQMLAQGCQIHFVAQSQRAFSMGAGYFTWALPVQAIKIYRNNKEFG
jgi:hypothetical protein